MDHKEFIEKYKSGEINVFVNRAKALRVINEGYLPKNYYYAHVFWTFVWFLSILAGVIILFLKLWLGIALLFFSILLGKAVKK